MWSVSFVMEALQITVSSLAVRELASWRWRRHCAERDAVWTTLELLELVREGSLRGWGSIVAAVAAYSSVDRQKER